jgi:hypothetical protein
VPTSLHNDLPLDAPAVGPGESGSRDDGEGSLGSRDKAFVVTFALLSLAAIVPIWRVRFLPLLDLPNHLAAVHIWHNFDAPWSRAKEFYELSLKPAPYCAYHVLTHVLAFVTGLENANRLVLSGYVVAIPAAALWWTRRTRRSPWFSVLTFPLAFSLSWACGFLPFLVGFALLLLGVAALDAFVERPTFRRAVAVVLLSVGCGLGHPLILFAYYVCVAALLLCHLPGWKRLGVTVVLFAPAAALFVWQVLAFKSPLVRVQGGPRFEGAWVPVRDMFESFPAYTLDSVSGALDTTVFWVMLVAALLLFVWGLFARGAGGSAPGPGPVSLLERVRDSRSLVLAAAMMACYLIVPLHLARPFDWWFVSGRFAPLICFFGFLTPKAPVRGAARLVMAPAVVAALLLPLHLSGKYAEFDERLKPFARMVERIPPGADDLLVLVLPPRTDEAVIIEATNHLSSWAQIMRGGFSPDGWFNVGFPFLLKRSLPAPPWNRNEWFDPAVHAAPYEYVIVRNDKPERPIFTAQHRGWHRVEREGAFTLYARAQPLQNAP